MINKIEKKLTHKITMIPKTFSISSDVWRRLDIYCKKRTPNFKPSNVVNEVLDSYLREMGIK